MRGYHWIHFVLLMGAAFGAGYFVEWYTSPLAAPLCLGVPALPGEYVQYWGLIGAGFALAALVVIVELGVIIHRLRCYAKTAEIAG